MMYWSCMVSLLLLALLVEVGANCDEKSSNIRFPFGLKNHQNHHYYSTYAYPGFELSCSGNHTVLEFPKSSLKFFVKHIDYTVIEVYDPNNCIYRQLLKIHDLSSISPFGFAKDLLTNYTLFNCSILDKVDSSSNSNSLYYKAMIPCLGGQGFNILLSESQYAVIEDLPLYCTKEYNTLPLPNEDYGDLSNRVYNNKLRLKWFEPDCGHCEARGKRCRPKYNNNATDFPLIECFHPKGEKKKNVAVGATLGTAVMIVVIVLVYRAYNSNKEEKEHKLRIESFLEDYKALKPSRYTYADIKQITNQFMEKLGEGAYGTVYKGKLSADFLVSVKMLHSSKGNGEEFINEVGIIGQIHHINVVRLVGYCADGARRALVYEFSPNGSLQRCISSSDSEHFLGWEKLQHITLGIAKGIEYLHQGCDQRILHFDIKPHNVLLDNNFTPKISDFGLAKLCSKDQSIVSMTTARGTLGYIAPEVFSRNFGNVSYKSDVYSFGMVVLEMVGGKKITNDMEENKISQVYYPDWIYNLLEGGEDLRIHINIIEDANIAKKLAIVGLWCIQWHPSDRPSMKVVVQMLEGEENLTIPPNPFGSTGPTKTIELKSIPELE